MFKRQVKKEIVKLLVEDAFYDKQTKLEVKEKELNKKEIIVKNNGTRLINEIRTSQELTDKITQLQQEKEKCKRTSIREFDDKDIRAKQIEFTLEFIKWFTKK